MPLQKTRLAAVSNSISLESHSELYRTGFYIVLLKQSSPFNKKSFSCLMLLQRSTWIRFIHKCARSQTLDFDLCADNNTDGPSLLSSQGFISKSCETTEQFRTSSQRATAFLHLVCAVFKMYLVLHSWKGWYLTILFRPLAIDSFSLLVYVLWGNLISNLKEMSSCTSNSPTQLHCMMPQLALSINDDFRCHTVGCTCLWAAAVVATGDQLMLEDPKAARGQPCQQPTDKRQTRIHSFTAWPLVCYTLPNVSYLKTSTTGLSVHPEKSALKS